MKYCPYCGARLDDDMLFCPKCGKQYKSRNHENGSITEDDFPNSDRINHEKQWKPPTEGKFSTKREKTRSVLLIIILCLIAASIITGLTIITGRNTDTQSSTDYGDANLKDDIHAYHSPGGLDFATESVLYLEVFDHHGNLVSTASGFFVNDGITLITNYHVMENAYQIVAWTSDGQHSTVADTIIAYDSVADIAALRCASDLGVAPLSIGDSNQSKQGDTIYAVGYPLGISNTLSNGVISSIYTDFSGIDMIQITAPISNGSSGGALLTPEGAVIGVICAYYEGGQNLNLAVAISEVENMLESPPEPIKLSSFYSENHIYGNSAVNIVYGAIVAASDEYYYYSMDYSVYCYEKGGSGSSRRVGNGRFPNIYQGHLYYVDDNLNAICRCDLDGANKSFLELAGINNNAADLYYTSMLIAEKKAVLAAYYDLEENSSLYIIDLESGKVLSSIFETSCYFTYVGNTVFVGTENSSMIAVNLRTMEQFSYPVSCVPSICGVDSDGILYYVDEYKPFEKCIYSLDPETGKEKKDTRFTGKKAGYGSAYNLSVYENNLYISTLTSTGKGLEYSIFVQNYLLTENGNVQLWGQQDKAIRNINVIEELACLYLEDGTTIDILTGQAMGKWVFDLEGTDNALSS